MLNFVPRAQLPFEDSFEAQAQSNLAMVPSLNEYVAATTEGSFAGAAARRARRGLYDPTDWFGKSMADVMGITPNMATDSPTLEPKQLNEMFPLPEGMEPLFSKPLPKSLANEIYYQKVEELRRDSIIQRYSEGHGWTNRFIWGSVGSMLDPGGFATAIIPGFGEGATFAATAARLGWSTRTALIAGKVASGLTGGAMAGGAFSAVRLGIADDSGVDEYSLKEAALDTFNAAMTNAGFHVAFAKGGGVASQLIGLSPRFQRVLNAADLDSVHSAVGNALGLTTEKEISDAIEHAVFPAITDEVVRQNQINDTVKHAVAEALGSDKPLTQPELAEVQRALSEVPQAEADNGLIDTRGQGTQYHGSPRDAVNPDPNYFNPDNIYGQGFYTTDAADIAEGYSKRNKGNPNGSLHSVTAAEGTRVFNMEDPIPEWLTKDLEPLPDGTLPPDLMEMVRAADPETVTRALRAIREAKLTNTRELFNTIRKEVGREHAQEIFDTFRKRMEAQGFRGMSHVGGLLTGFPKHAVTIYFHPEDLKISKVERATLSRNPGEAAVARALGGTEGAGFQAESRALSDARVEAAKIAPDELHAKLATAVAQALDGRPVNVPDNESLPAVAKDQANLYRDGYTEALAPEALRAAQEDLANAKPQPEPPVPAAKPAGEVEGPKPFPQDKFTPVASTNIRAIAHEGSRLQVEFLNGAIYEYSGVPESLARQFEQSESKGKFLKDKIKGVYEFQKVAAKAPADPEMQMEEAALAESGAPMTPEVEAANAEYDKAFEESHGFEQAAQCVLKAGI